MVANPQGGKKGRWDSPKGGSFLKELKKGFLPKFSDAAEKVERGGKRAHGVK